jgi:hypothetical protein
MDEEINFDLDLSQWETLKALGAHAAGNRISRPSRFLTKSRLRHRKGNPRPLVLDTA